MVKLTLDITCLAYAQLGTKTPTVFVCHDHQTPALTKKITWAYQVKNTAIYMDLVGVETRTEVMVAWWSCYRFNMPELK